MAKVTPSSKNTRRAPSVAAKAMPSGAPKSTSPSHVVMPSAATGAKTPMRGGGGGRVGSGC